MSTNGTNGANGATATNGCPPTCAPGVLGASGGIIDAGGRLFIASLYETVTRRIRAARTIFGDNVKLVMRQLDTEHWALLQLPYCLVVPTVTRPEIRPADQDRETIINPRSVTMICQLDAHDSEAEWAAATDIEIAEKQLIGALVNWKPAPHYKPTAYAGMRVMAARAPDVKVSFIFTFYEELYLFNDDEIGIAFDDPANAAQLDGIEVRVNDGCCPADVTDPCAEVPPISVTSGVCK